MDPRQIKDRSNLANEVIVRNNLIKLKLVKQLSLIVIQPPHHRPPPQQIVSGRRNHRSQRFSTDFCNKICQQRSFARWSGRRETANAGTADLLWPSRFPLGPHVEAGCGVSCGTGGGVTRRKSARFNKSPDIPIRRVYAPGDLSYSGALCAIERGLCWDDL